MLWEPTVQPDTPQEGFSLLPLVLAELLASFSANKVLSILLWALLTLWCLPLVIFEISPLLFRRQEVLVTNVR